MSKKKVFLVFVKLRWSATYEILSKWSVVVKRLGNNDIINKHVYSIYYYFITNLKYQ